MRSQNSYYIPRLMEVGGDRPEDDVRPSKEMQLHQETDHPARTLAGTDQTLTLGHAKIHSHGP